MKIFKTMKRKIKVEKEVNIKTLVVKAGVRYWEDAMVNGVEDTEGELIPCRQADYWCPIIDIDRGVITNWKQGVSAEIHYKVCDDGEYTLLDDDGNQVVKTEGYVHSILSPKGNGYSDYIFMDVKEDGTIDNWEIDLDDFFEEQED